MVHTASSLATPAPLLHVRDLTVALPQGGDRQYAVQGVSLTLARGEVLCVVGESGSGKSVMANAVAGLLPPTLAITGGSIQFDGRELVGASEPTYRRLRGARIGMIFQEPMTALNPVVSIGVQMDESLRAHGISDAGQRRARALELFDAMRLPQPAALLNRFPHQISGGQRQRVMIAIALANKPDLLIADEPTTALDVTTQAEVLRLIADLQRSMNLAVLFITHDFGVVADIAHRVLVMNRGHAVEAGPAAQVLDHPSDPYTQRLIGAVPRLLAVPAGVAAASPATAQDAAKATEPAVAASAGITAAAVASSSHDGGATSSASSATPGTPLPTSASTPLLQIRDLVKTYPGKRNLFGKRAPGVHAVNHVSLDIARGETVAVVGESGSGKSTLGRCIVRLLDIDGGSIHLDGADLGQARGAELARLRTRMQMVFQDPYASLNPRQRIRSILTRPAQVQGVSAADAEARMHELLEWVGLDAGAADRWPHEFSGGQRQRIALARALMSRPSLLIADEPVSALDVSIQAQVLALLADIRQKLQLSMLFITHDLRVAASVADRIVVMQRGEIVEMADTATLLASPQAPYTRLLLSAIPGRAWEERRAAA